MEGSRRTFAAFLCVLLSLATFSCSPPTSSADAGSAALVASDVAAAASPPPLAPRPYGDPGVRAADFAYVANLSHPPHPLDPVSGLPDTWSTRTEPHPFGDWKPDPIPYRPLPVRIPDPIIEPYHPMFVP
jgi:hypothetical protein